MPWLEGLLGAWSNPWGWGYGRGDDDEGGPAAATPMSQTTATSPPRYEPFSPEEARRLLDRDISERGEANG